MLSELGISFIYLIGGGTIDHPVHSYQYEYTSEYGVRAAADGTPFYIRERPTLELDFLVGIGSDILLTANIDSGIDTPKFTSEPSMDLTIEKIFALSDSEKVTFSIDFSFQGDLRNIACTDATGKEFHCYHGVRPTDPYYLLSVDEIDRIYGNKIGAFRGVGIKYEMIF